MKFSSTSIYRKIQDRKLHITIKLLEAIIINRWQDLELENRILSKKALYMNLHQAKLIWLRSEPWIYECDEGKPVFEAAEHISSRKACLFPVIVPSDFFF